MNIFKLNANRKLQHIAKWYKKEISIKILP